ncbi:MAG: hypothetical protein U9N52_04440 [Campylobacterota bacterium]|nr:hypothetical protein [Campylobacterota bacterium]
MTHYADNLKKVYDSLTMKKQAEAMDEIKEIRVQMLLSTKQHLRIKDLFEIYGWNRDEIDKYRKREDPLLPIEDLEKPDIQGKNTKVMFDKNSVEKWRKRNFINIEISS